jgi:hypothetical protein
MPKSQFQTKTIFVTGGNDAYAGLMAELIESLKRQSLKLGLTKEDFSIGIIDAGLTEHQRAYFQAQDCFIVKPDWPQAIPTKRQKDAPSFLKACVWRPYLPQLFPDFKKIISVDADVWCQDFSSFLMFDEASQNGQCAITLNVDRSYGKQMRVKWLGPVPIKVSGFYMSNARKALGMAYAKKLFHYPVASAGIFAAECTSPLWARWQEWMEKICQKGNLFTAEQLSLGFALHIDQCPAKFLPSHMHWIASYTPFYDEAHTVFVEPNPPYTVLGNLHLSGIDEIRANRKATLEIRHLQGGSSKKNLRNPLFNGDQALSDFCNKVR